MTEMGKALSTLETQVKEKNAKIANLEALVKESKAQ